MGKDVSATPKGTLTLKSLGAGFGKESIAAAGVTTLKFKKNSLAGSLAFDDNTLKNVKVSSHLDQPKLRPLSLLAFPVGAPGFSHLSMTITRNIS